MKLLVIFPLLGLVQAIPLKEYYRSRIITKDDFINSREKKGLQQLPKPFVVSSSLTVVSQPSKSDSRSPKSLFQIPSENTAPIVHGVRMPDDDSDSIIWRDGRIINNVFVPKGKEPKQFRNGKSISGLKAPYYYTPEGEIKGQPQKKSNRQGRNLPLPNLPNPPFFGDRLGESPRDYSFKAGESNNGRPVYYVVDEPTPTDHTSVLPGNSGSLSPANSNDFVIKEHTYTMCPGCPSFSIPVPIPKASYYQNGASPVKPTLNPQTQSNSSFFESVGDKIIATFEDLQNSVLGSSSKDFLGGVSEKIDRDSVNPGVLAGAAVALGGLAYLAASGDVVESIAVGRSFDNSLPEILTKEPECMPENKCLILYKHLNLSPELQYAKKYYSKEGFNLSGADLCSKLKCKKRQELSTLKLPKPFLLKNSLTVLPSN